MKLKSGSSQVLTLSEEFFVLVAGDEDNFEVSITFPYIRVKYNEVF